MKEDASGATDLQRAAKLVSRSHFVSLDHADFEQSMSVCVCTLRRMHCWKPEGSESAKTQFFTATRKSFELPVPF